MSDNTRRETASTDTPHPARHPFPPRGAAPGRAAVRTVPRPERYQSALRGGRWPDARTAEALLAGRVTEPAAPAGAAPVGPADRLVRLLSAAREVSSTLDPEREAAALAAFRDATAGRAAAADRTADTAAAAAADTMAGADPARGGGAGPRSGARADSGTGSGTASGTASGAGLAHGRRFGALRGAFAVRRPGVMVAAVASALALGGVAVGMAAARTSPAGGGGSGTSPLVTRPPAAVSPDGGRSDPRTPPSATTTPAPPPGADRGRSVTPHPGRACGRNANPLCPPGAAGNGRGGKGENGQYGEDGGYGPGGGDKGDKADQGDRAGRQDRAGRAFRSFGDGSRNGPFTAGRGGMGTWGRAPAAR